jgi:hypothetical protein
MKGFTEEQRAKLATVYAMVLANGNFIVLCEND